jgi:hypothetical protein
VELGAARVCGERRPEVEFTVVASMADGGGSGSREWRPAGFYRQACLGEGVTSITARWAAAWARRWRGEAANSRPGAARRAYGGDVVSWRRRSVPRGL